ncbi:hypothetical protein SSX86_008406 [Deinandra increscens subsp. villosa]|uniref:Uncharacterized protein n=1 Tax=Deinandra increscens subsp. villosa TaxID=3103831 RepID=A0AAP0DF60_9ASTR
MNYQSTPRSYRPKGFIMKHGVQLALFAAFSLWLLYQIRQPAGNSGPGRQLSNDHISNFLGRKGSAGTSKSTLDPQPGLTSQDVANPGEEGEIQQNTKEIETVEFNTKRGSLKPENGNKPVSHGNEDTPLTVAKSNISFPDENGIPEHVRGRFIEIESNNSVNTTRVQSQRHSQSQSQSKDGIVSRVGDGMIVSVDES